MKESGLSLKAKNNTTLVFPIFKLPASTLNLLRLTH